MPTTITNSFHNTEVTIRANAGDAVSPATLRKVQKVLCGIREFSVKAFVSAWSNWAE